MYISFLHKSIKYELTHRYLVTLPVANRARVALVSSHFSPTPTFFPHAFHFLNLWLPVEKRIVPFLNRSSSVRLRLITADVTTVARLFVTTVFTSNLSNGFTRSTFFRRVIALRSHAKMSFNLRNGENTGLDGSFRRSISSSRLYPSLSVISPSEHSSALKLNNSVNGNGVSTAKDSDSSFDVEPVCSHVSRITRRGIEVF